MRNQHFDKKDTDMIKVIIITSITDTVFLLESVIVCMYIQVLIFVYASTQNKLFIDHYQNIDDEQIFYHLIRDSYKKTYYVFICA